LPLLAADPRLALPGGELPATLRVAVGIAPFCGLLGFLTPLLVDRWAAGDPLRAGTAYAVNTLGCILGPLISGFALLPLLGERWTLVALAFPLFAFGAAAVPGRAGFRPQRTVAAVFCVSAATALFLILFTKSYESAFPGCEVRRDHTATVIAAGEGMQKQLLINGMGITSLTPITKMMVHLPMAFLERPPRNGIVLCFGMGTSFRSMLAWGIATTGVELVPSVPSLFAFYHRDGDQLRQSALARIVIDDARRFLERSRETYDVIAVDPPPPVEAAGSSLLYSREFYETARRRLRPGGILQQWLPDGSPTLVSAVALAETFPHVRAFFSVEGWGVHFLASTRPIPVRTATELAARLPAAAARDLIEWGPAPTPVGQFQAVVSREVPMWRLIEADPGAPTLTDDRPVNEYYFLRNMFGSGNS
jgi:spermidine synthase